DSMSPGVQNLFTLLRASGRMDAHDSLMDDYKNGSLKYSDLKEQVGHGLADIMMPIKSKYDAVIDNKKEVKDSIKASSAEIRKRAKQTLREVKEIAGLLNPKD
ncbi:MAG: tryptophan--tRNA ligase, partial [Saprospiraceae bacterium]|nr:tryptophan--tRNA ligase [Saprospiraceae bacterium]